MRKEQDRNHLDQQKREHHKNNEVHTCLLQQWADHSNIQLVLHPKLLVWINLKVISQLTDQSAITKPQNTKAKKHHCFLRKLKLMFNKKLHVNSWKKWIYRWNRPIKKFKCRNLKSETNFHVRTQFFWKKFLVHSSKWWHCITTIFLKYYLMIFCRKKFRKWTK